MTARDEMIMMAIEPRITALGEETGHIVMAAECMGAARRQ